MTSVYEDDIPVPCTILETQVCVVTQIKKVATDGYEAVQIACEEKKEKNTTKPLQGHFAKAKTTPKRKVKEFRNFLDGYPEDNLECGNTITAAAIFQENEFIDVCATSKGKGFCGVVKRHNFRGVGDQTHGQHNRQRAGGSIGGCSYPSRVFKGIGMPGRKGGQRTTLCNLKILKIIPEENIIVIKGSVPGPRGNYVTIQK